MPSAAVFAEKISYFIYDYAEKSAILFLCVNQKGRGRMEYFREELFPCVSLTAVQTDKFKTGILTGYLLTQLRRETAAENAVLPYVLRRGTTSLPDMKRISEHLDEMYGASVEPSVRKLGEIQAIGFSALFPEDHCLPGKTDVLGDTVRLMGELWLSPATRGGLLLPDYVNSERDKLVERIESAKNDKRSWAVKQLFANMCAFEDYAVGAHGTADEAENIHYVKLTKHYKNLLSTSPMEFFYCGSRPGREVAELLRSAFALLPRGEIDLELGTDIRMNAVEDEPRYFTEEDEVSQGVLAVGWRLGECMDDPDPAAIAVFNTVFGGGVASKLFLNVREKLSLCYYASSSCDIFKGIMAVCSGIEFDKYDAALKEILAQLDAVRNGDISDEELSTARRTVAGNLRTGADSPYYLADFYLRQTVQGLDASPDDLAELAEGVTAGQVAAIAQSTVLDAVYFLRGEEADAE